MGALCALYGVTGDDKEALLERVSQPADPAAWLATGYVPDQLASLMVLEQEARTITYVEVALISGLVQTADYARLAFGGAANHEDLEKRITTRLGRQSLLTRPRAPQVRLYLAEGVLHRTLGRPEVLRDQLEQLIILQRRENISIRVIPFSAGECPPTSVSFSLYGLADGSPYVFLEAQKLGVFVTEPAETRPFVDSCQALDTCALDEQSSSALMRKVAEGFSDD